MITRQELKDQRQKVTKLGNAVFDHVYNIPAQRGEGLMLLNRFVMALFNYNEMWISLIFDVLEMQFRDDDERDRLISDMKKWHDEEKKQIDKFR